MTCMQQGRRAQVNGCWLWNSIIITILGAIQLVSILGAIHTSELDRSEIDL